MRPHARKLHALGKCLARAHVQSWMFHLVIDDVSPLAESRREALQRPDCMSARVHFRGHLARILHGLGIAGKLMQQFGRRRAKEPFNYGPKAWLVCWALLFSDPVAREEWLKVNRAKVRTAINHQFLR